MRMTQNFTSTVSHEMRTPLASIKYFVKLLMAIYPNGLDSNPESKRYFKLIVAQLTLIMTFVDDLLDMRQLKEGAFSLEKSIFSPSSIIRQVIDIFTPQANGKQLELLIEFAE